MNPARPPLSLLEAQAAWLAPARAALLRRVQVARRRRILDLGCGPGVVTRELARRGGGRTVALDRDPAAVASVVRGADVAAVAGRAERLPFRDASFDLAFGQFALLWMPVAETLAECIRILAPGGAVAFVEPDFGGLIEHPEALRPVWRAALSRAGADPDVGRRLPGALARLGLRCEIRLLDTLRAPDPARLELLDGLGLEPAERERVEAVRRDGQQVSHLPIFLVAGWKDGP